MKDLERQGKFGWVFEHGRQLISAPEEEWRTTTMFGRHALYEGRVVRNYSPCKVELLVRVPVVNIP